MVVAGQLFQGSQQVLGHAVLLLCAGQTERSEHVIK